MITAAMLVALPWSWVGPKLEVDGPSRSFVVRIRELPDFFVAAETKEQARVDAADALEAFIASYLQGSDVLPLPAGLTLEKIRNTPQYHWRPQLAIA
jgi:predicted RNase H-like HicB family nuclease